MSLGDFFHVLKRERLPFASAACAGILIFAGSWFSYDRYLSSAAREIAEAWRKSDNATLAEGNILTALIKGEPFILSSSFVEGVKVADISQAQSASSDKGALMELGKPFDIDPQSFKIATNEIEILRSGFLTYQAVIPFTSQGLLVVFSVVPSFIRSIFVLSTSALAAGIFALVIVTAFLNRREQLIRLQFLRSAISSLVQAKAPPRELVEWAPDLVSSWSNMLHQLEQMNQKVIEGERLAAIARTTQMLAHDVRKPFSILKMGLGMLGNAKDPAGVKNVLSRLVPEVDRAVSSVNGLISDVMEIGSTSTELIQEPASPESLIEATLGEIFRVYPKAAVSLSYDLKHTSMVNVHVQNVGRVFSNIIGNAVQAMGQKGKIWFRTREDDGFVEFCIGNAASLIPAENRPKLFEAFFTSGKKGGTGLGLAIAQKVVIAHGGRIWCESGKTLEHPDGQVEFFFTLPMAEGHLCKTTAHLASHSSEISGAFLAMAEVVSSVTSISVDKGELTLETEIIEASRRLLRPLRVLIIDDEPVYRSALITFLSRTSELSQAISISEADGSPKALKVLSEASFDLIITDIDMGPHSLDGFELVREICQRSGHGGSRALIVVHSNRMVPNDNKAAIEAGADAFLPKPIARAQLLKEVLLSLQRLAREGATKSEVPPHLARKPVVVIVEDDVFVSEAWENALAKEASLYIFESPDALEVRLKTEPHFLAVVTLVVTDFYFNNSHRTGSDVGQIVKSRSPGIPVLVSSNGELSQLELTHSIDKVIPKIPVKYSELTQLIPALGGKPPMFSAATCR